MRRVDRRTFDMLRTPEGRRLLEVGMASDESDPLVLSQRLKAQGDGYPPELVAAVLTQVSLRRAAFDKFGVAAAGMYFTPSGLEQATHPVVAAHRVARSGPGEGRSCLDLGCGIGSDLTAFARAGFDVTGVEADDVTAALAAANLEALGLPGRVTVGAAETADLEPFDLVFADPARRRGTTRIFDPRAFSPSWDLVLHLLTPAAVDGHRPAAVVKLGPGLDHALVPADAEAEWVSLQGQLKEVALRSPATGSARRRATLLDAEGRAAFLTDEDATQEAPPVAAVGSYVYEPDPAVVRAHLVSVVVEVVEGWLLDPHIAYISSDRRVSTTFARGFRVVEALPFKEKQLRAALRARNIGALTIKKRGVGVTPEVLRRRLDLHGDEPATLILARTPRSATALLVEPLG